MGSFHADSVDFVSGALSAGGVQYTKLSSSNFETVATGGPNTRLVVTDIVAGGCSNVIKFKSSSVLTTSDDSGNLVLAVPANTDISINYASPLRLPKGAALLAAGASNTIITVHYHVEHN
jgi:hypothetical protein